MLPITIELWNHGLASNPAKPCGEVDVFNVSGFKIDSNLLKLLLIKDPYGEKFDWFNHLPTEKPLKVIGIVSFEEEQFWIDVFKFEELKGDK